jgi:hypothetical protein
MYDFYLNAPPWGSDSFMPPKEAHNATVLKTVVVRNARVIHIEEGCAKYRDAEFGGTFALADYQSDNLDDKLWKFIHVQVLWFGQRLKKQCPDVLVDLSRARVQIGYTGRVVSNIGRRKSKD